MIAPALRACNSRWCDCMGNCVCHYVPCAWSWRPGSSILEKGETEYGCPIKQSGGLAGESGRPVVSPGGESKALNVTDLLDTAQVCNCNGVSKGKIIGAVKAGHRSLESVCDATRAGTGCGSCKPHIQALLELASDGLVVNDPPYRVPVHS